MTVAELGQHILPADIHAERAVLGAVLLESDAILAVRDIVSTADFYLEKHAWVYDAMLACVSKRTPPDLVTVADELRQKDRLDSIGGIALLSELSADTPTATFADHYAGIVARTAAQRRAIELSGHIQAAAYNPQCDPDNLYQEIAAMLQVEQRTSRTAPNWAAHTISADRLYRKHFDPQPEIIQDILPQGTFLLTGKPKTKKSWLALNYALSVAWGGKALGHFQATQGEVLYIDLEMGQRRLHERLHIVSPDIVVPKTLHFAEEWPKVFNGCERWLEEWMESHPFTRLIVIDTQVAIRPPRDRNEEPYEHEKRYTQVLTNFCHHYGIAMMLIHHSRKVAGSDVIDDASGTTGLTGGVDNYGSLSRSPNERNGGVLSLAGRDIRIDDDLNLTWDATIASWCYSDVDYTLTRERREVLRLLGEYPGLYPNQIAAKLKKDRESIRQLLKRMKEAEQVVSEDGQYYADPPHEPLTV